ncbi:hypothetical protein NXY56_002273 [Leishmania guyanensis]
MHTLPLGVLSRRLSGWSCAHFAAARPLMGAGVDETVRRFYATNTSKSPSAFSTASGGTSTEAHTRETLAARESAACFHLTKEPSAITSGLTADAAGASPPPPTSVCGADSSTAIPTEAAFPVVPPSGASSGGLTTPDPEPVRWVQPVNQDLDTLPIVDAKGEYIVSRVQWPIGEVAYRTPAPVDDKLAPRFGYNVVQVRKHVSWWKYNQKYPRLSIAYINIQLLFILGLAWLVAFLTTEYRRAMEAMRTPGAIVGEHRGRGPPTNSTQRISFDKQEMNALLDQAQNNWFDGKAEASYVGSKEYKMRKIPRPKEFSTDDFRKR